MFHRTAVLLGVAMVFVAAGCASALDIGDKAPEFKATGIDGKECSLEKASKGADVVVF